MVPVDPGNLRDVVIACVIIAGAWGLWDLIQLYQ